MDRFVNIVDFEVQPGKADEVVALVSENARKSVETEPGVLQFDVVRVADNPNRCSTRSMRTRRRSRAT